MAKQLKKHTCNDSCKGRSVNTVSCFLCSELFYAKCFLLDASTQSKINQIDSYIRFICGICQSNCNINKRKSLTTPVNNSQSSTSTGNNNNNSLNDDIKKILDLLSTRAPSNNSINNAPSNNSSDNDSNGRIIQQSTTGDSIGNFDTFSNELKLLTSSINEIKEL